MNLVEVWFGIVERQAILRGVFESVKDLSAKIRAFIDGWHDGAHPFVWTKTAEQILAKANRPIDQTAEIMFADGVWMLASLEDLDLDQ